MCVLSLQVCLHEASDFHAIFLVQYFLTMKTRSLCHLTNIITPYSLHLVNSIHRLRIQSKITCHVKERPSVIVIKYLLFSISFKFLYVFRSYKIAVIFVPIEIMAKVTSGLQPLNHHPFSTISTLRTYLW